VGDSKSDSLTSHGRSLAQQVLAATRADFELAASRMSAEVIISPVLPLYSATRQQIALKAENLQPFGSFKVRAGVAALATIEPAVLARGVVTASAGNFAQGLAFAAKRRGVRLIVHVPETAAAVKVAAIESLGANIVRHSFDEWWHIMRTREGGDEGATFIHPVCEPAVIIGNGTIGLELLQQASHFDTVFVPFGGGGLVCGIAQALRSAGWQGRVVACEVETSTPLAAAFAHGGPIAVERHASFIDGIGSKGVLEEMWPLLHRLVDDVAVISVAEAKAALRKLAVENHLIVEGAGAVALAAALKASPPAASSSGKSLLAVLSGGNIDTAILHGILAESVDESIRR
jgi:threonine dehydratase